MSYLKDKVIWLTGASSGIGEALAYEFSKKGAKLILSSRNKEALEKVKYNCTAKEVVILTIDLEDSFSLPQKAKEAETFFGPIDLLVNNAGISQRDLIINTKLEVDRRLMEVNFFAPISLSKSLLPSMIKRKRGHHVIVTSTVGIINTPYRSGYGASKHALHGYYEALAAEHYKDRIKVTMVIPGYIKTNISYNALLGDGSKQNQMDKGQANGLSSEKCAKAIVHGIEKKKRMVYIGGIKEITGIYIKRFFPALAALIIRNIRVV